MNLGIVNRITYGGGFLAHTIRLLTITLKRLYLALSNLVRFCFYLLDFGRILAKSIHQEGCRSCFLNETSRKIEHTIFLFRFKTMEMQRRYKFVPGKMCSSIKSGFSRVLLHPRGVNIESR